MVLRLETKNRIKLSSSRVSRKQLEAFVYENKAWILQQRDKIKEPFELDSSFYYLGEAYRVKHHFHAFRMDEETVYMNPLKAQVHSDEFYKKTAREQLPSKVEFWKRKMDLEFNTLGFRLAKKRWGSCNSKRNISLNPYIMKLRPEMIDYIIVHELAHLVHLNHSKEFYHLIENYLPEYRKVENEIKSFALQIN